MKGGSLPFLDYMFPRGGSVDGHPERQLRAGNGLGKGKKEVSFSTYRQKKEQAIAFLPGEKRRGEEGTSRMGRRAISPALLELLEAYTKRKKKGRSSRAIPA